MVQDSTVKTQLICTIIYCTILYHLIVCNTTGMSQLKIQKVTLNKIDYNNNSSEWVRINCGVSQGAILDPLFFLIYINDLPTLINKDNNIVLYADDTSIVIMDTNRDDFKDTVNRGVEKTA